MALKAILETSFGETRELYVRLNNFDTVSKHAQSAARFRGFLSQEAFEAGKSFVWEREISFVADLSDGADAIARQAYGALRGQCAEFGEASDI
ncbi:MAG: hypothetical protein J0I79_20885 [Mesorhizobium sp.]|uniref:hypothetical protein n=1 Tax=Mesorhizobium sp. TaxID=1871066 RepID=UPI001AD161C5|nr:hypothetical protein [Mesorhizobium sp.]MBN9220411.1 hypothetical protein [Mesorhizobium sp.]